MSLFHSPIAGPSLFEQAWTIYPDRHVSENKRDALRQWLRRLKENVDPLEMLEGAKRYRKYADKLRLTGTTFVMQPRRFFGPSRHFELEWEIQVGSYLTSWDPNYEPLAKLKRIEAERLPPEEAKSILQGIREEIRKRRDDG